MKNRNWVQPELTYWAMVADFIESPHILIGGVTGSGKSVLMNDIMFYLSSCHPLHSQAYIIDLKRVEYIQWDIPHIKEVVKDEDKIVPCLDKIIREMDLRYRVMERKRVRKCNYTHIYLIIDEMSEVLTVKGVRERLDKMMRLARAANIHVIGATQNVSRGKGGIPAELQKNFTVCIGLHCKSAIESRQIIGESGCERLPLYGEALIAYPSQTKHVKVPFTPDAWIEERNRVYRTYR